MEKELLTENLVKAQGHKDAIFFYRESKAHLVLKSRDISEKQFAQLVEIVSVVAGINMEDVVIIEKPWKKEAGYICQEKSYLIYLLRFEVRGSRFEVRRGKYERLN